MAVMLFLTAAEQFLPLIEQSAAHGRKALFAFQIIFHPTTERAFADIVRKPPEFFSGFGVEQTLHLFVQGFVIATGLFESFAAAQACGLPRLILAGESGAKIFDSHGIASP